jgi:cholesterol 25-hydroxylase
MLLTLGLSAVAAFSPSPVVLRPSAQSTLRCNGPVDILSEKSSPLLWLEQQAPATTALQAMHLSMLAGGILDAGAMDAGAAAIWHGFDALTFTHAPMFEASLAVSAFVFWIVCFESLHLVLPNAERFRLDGSPPLRPLWGFGKHAHKSLVPAAAYLVSIFVLFAGHPFTLGHDLFDPLLGARPDVWAEPSFGRIATEVSLGVFLYDLLFYPFHYSFHARRSAGHWRKLHSRHHEWGREPAAHNAIETVQNSYVDAGIQVAINICVQQLSPWGHKHPLSRCLHNLMVTYLLSEAHSGYDLPFMSHRLFPNVFGGPVAHEAHHQHSAVCYHQFFTWIDRLNGWVPTDMQRAAMFTRAHAAARDVSDVDGAPADANSERHRAEE